MPTQGSCTVIVGCQWGDEGKGKIVDVLAEGVPGMSLNDTREYLQYIADLRLAQQIRSAQYVEPRNRS